MDSDRFDALTRALAMETDRRTFFRRILAGLAAGSLAMRGATGRADSDCAHFCRNLPPGQRGQCVSGCQQGKGLHVECDGDPTRLCVASDGASATCCAAGSPCRDGVCDDSQCTALEGLCHQSSECCSGCCDIEDLRCVDANGGTCLPEPQPPCDGIANGGLCNQNSQCCSGCCDIENLRCVEAAGDTCLPEGCGPGGFCAANSGCCTGCCGVESLQCIEGTGHACLPEPQPPCDGIGNGGLCHQSSECCSGCCDVDNLKCVEGTGDTCV